VTVLLHPLAVHFPLALWLTSALFDLLAWRGEDPLYRRPAYWLVGLGLLGALVSIALGWIDLLAQEHAGVGTGLLLRHRLHSEAAYVATLVFGMNLGWRWWTSNRLSATLLTLSLVGVLLVVLTGYLGGDLRSVM
jgi:uncharacterized membrane protein